VWNFIILYPFLTSAQTELWHLIPVYLPLSFIVSAGIYEGISSAFAILRRLVEVSVPAKPGVSNKSRFVGFFTPFRKILKNNHHILINSSFLLFFAYIIFLQIKTFYSEVYPGGKWIPDDVAISKAAAKYNKPIFLDDDYLPIAVFYSGKNVQQLSYLPDDKKTLEKFIQSGEKNYVVITRNWVVEDLKKKNLDYKLLEKNNSFSILTKLNQ